MSRMKEHDVAIKEGTRRVLEKYTNLRDGQLNALVEEVYSTIDRRLRRNNIQEHIPPGFEYEIPREIEWY